MMNKETSFKCCRGSANGACILAFLMYGKFFHTLHNSAMITFDWALTN